VYERPERKCFSALPVQVLRHPGEERTDEEELPMFLEPLTHRIVRQAYEIPCDQHWIPSFLNGAGRWTQATPKLKYVDSKESEHHLAEPGPTNPKGNDPALELTWKIFILVIALQTFIHTGIELGRQIRQLRTTLRRSEELSSPADWKNRPLHSPEEDELEEDYPDGVPTVVTPLTTTKRPGGDKSNYLGANEVSRAEEGTLRLSL